MPPDLMECPAETALDHTEAHLTLVCLPPGTTCDPDQLRSQVTAQLAPHTRHTPTPGTAPGTGSSGTGIEPADAARRGPGAPPGRIAGSPALICPNRFTAPADLPPRARAVLIDPRPASVPGLLRCAGGPIGLLDFRVYPELAEQAAAGVHAMWEQAIAGTPAALPWRAFCGLDPDDPDDADGPVGAVDAFFDQPRIAAIGDHMAAGLLPPDLTELGPSLEAHQRGAAAYSAHLTASVLYSDALVTADGRLLAPGSATDTAADTGIGSTRRPPYAQTLAERDAYFTAARTHLAGLDPRTVLVAAHCRL